MDPTALGRRIGIASVRRRDATQNALAVRSRIERLLTAVFGPLSLHQASSLVLAAAGMALLLCGRTGAPAAVAAAEAP